MDKMDDFRALGISEATIEALRRKGFETPTPIQILTIPRLLANQGDLIGQAQTGTGKTAAFGIPIIEKCEPGAGFTQALILSPTRELCMQVAEEIDSLQGEKKLHVAPFFGGQFIEIQLQKLERGVDIAVGTPGRIIDLLERGALDLSQIRFAVLDEADEMLDMGFIDDIRKILSRTAPEKQMLMFSATMPPEIVKIAEDFMHGYEILRTEMKQLSTELTDQVYYAVRREDKFDALARILDTDPEFYGLVFCRTKGDVDEVVEKLKQRGYRVEALHGDIAQFQRTKVINLFKEKKFRILVATDVAARGIDVNDLTCVVNYSLPQSSEIYVHRVGRTGRAGKKGRAVTFVTPSEHRKIRNIQQEIKSEIRKETLPGGEAVIALKKAKYAEQLGTVEADADFEIYLAFARELLADASSPENLLAAALKLRFKKELLPSSYREFGTGEKQLKGHEFWEKSKERENEVRLHISVGKLDGFGAVRMLDLIWEKAHIRKSRVGKINCMDHFAFVNLAEDEAKQLIEGFRRNHGPKAEYAAELPETPAPAEEKPHREKKTPPEEKKPEKRMKKLPAAEKKRRLRDWVEKMSADIELKERRRKGKGKGKTPAGRHH